MRRGVAWAAGAVLAAALLAGATAGAATPKCFGAAARDTRRDCENPRLRLAVRPTPDEAAITPNLSCVREQINEVLDQCSYGTPADKAVESVAMIGDSHASHWRPALAVVARRKHWRVLEIARPHCPLSYALPDSGEPISSACVDWNRGVVGWLADHPEVRTVFVSANAQAPIVVPDGQSEWATRRDGFVAAWQALPASVQRLVVIRDTPTDRTKTHECIRHAMARHVPAGRTCRVARRVVLPPDAEVAAAKRLRARGARVVSLTHYFCGRRRCLPVVGGALVHKDVDHLTQQFAHTLGPYLLRAIDASADLP
jgi:SGNH domain-containing protein